MSSSGAPDLLPSASELHRQSGVLKLPVNLVGKNGTVTLDPHSSPSVKHYLDAFRDVRLHGPFRMSVRAPISAKISYDVDACVVPVEFKSDHPKGRDQVSGVEGAAFAFLSNIAPPSAGVVTHHSSITWQLKPKPLELSQPLFVIHFESEGTADTTVATCYIECGFTVAGVGFRKSW